MKLLASAAALACLAVVAAVAGPALSSSRWRPEPVDFEVAPAGPASHDVKPGKRFNLVGLRWRGQARPEVAIRSRLGGGRWTRWTVVSDYEDDSPDPGRGEPAARGLSAPVWVGEADQVQYRLSQPVSGLRLHFVNVLGTATAADRARTALRRATNSAAVSLAGIFRSHPARAAEPEPAMVSRKDWGAKDCPPRRAPDYGVVKAAFIHHTVNANDYTREEAPSIVLAICRYHRNSNGWNDIGYNFLVDRFGTIYEGRAGGVDQAVVGAQAQGYNAQSTGIANIGTFESQGQTREGMTAMARLIRWKLPLHGVPTSGSAELVSAGGSSNKYPSGTHVRVKRISGHRDVDATSCPGDALYSQLPELRRLVGDLPPAGNGTFLDAKLASASIRYGRSSVFSGTLTSLDGAPLGGQTVYVQVRRSHGWRSVAALTTDASGGFSLPLSPRGNRALRARFRGNGDLLPTSSPTLLLLVKPVIRLIDPPEDGAAKERVRFRGTVTPRKRTLWQVLELRRGGRWARVGLKRLAARGGRFRGSFVPERPGRFRYWVGFRGDRAIARGRSPRVAISVGR